jgi:glutathione synthase/RimK-type ligase-like ATP-grasp enzyme
MSDILIHSFNDDLHANAVMWALKKLDIPYDFWPSDQFPNKSSWSMKFAPTSDKPKHNITIDTQLLTLSEYKTVWYRRPRPPHISPAAHEDDMEFIERECRPHMRSMMRLISPDALWLNTPTSAEQDIYKPLQIKTAISVGFNIPHTLFSNNPEEIRAFFYDHFENIIYKSYRSSYWLNENQKTPTISIGYTARLRAEDLENDDALRISPGIFQQNIRKDYEVRVTVMGQSYIAVKILSQMNESTKEDWRLDHGALKIERILLPKKIEISCLAYMKKARLNFGCFDFIVTPEGEYYFLEVNQMGQFLWKEEMQADIPLLQMFCDFLISGNPEFKWREKNSIVKFHDYLDLFVTAL